MIKKGDAENGLDIKLYDITQKFEFDEPEFPEEIKLIPISSGKSLDQLGQVVYEVNNKKSSGSGYNVLNMKCYNNVNRARYAFLN